MGAPITSYDTLVSAVIEVAEDDSAEFQNYIPTAIGLAEQRLRKEMDKDGATVIVTVVANPGDPFIPKPNGYLLTRDLEVLYEDGSTRGLRKKTKSFVRDYWPIQSETTVDPVYYGDYDKNLFIIGGTPTSAMNFILTFDQKITALAPAAQTNYFIDEMPEALFYATMNDMMAFAKNWSVAQIWEQKYLNAIQGTNNEARRARRDDDTAPKAPTNVADNALMSED